jgi:hypothetical protein
MPSARPVVTGTLPVENRTLAARKPTARSRISNGRDWLANCDQRSSIARRYRDLIAETVADAGGLDECSQAKLQLIRRLAALSVQLEQFEAKLADGGEIDIGQYTALTSTLVRVIARLGVARHCKPVADFYRDVLPALANKPDPTNGVDDDDPV